MLSFSLYRTKIGQIFIEILMFWFCSAGSFSTQKKVIKNGKAQFWTWRRNDSLLCS